MRGKWKDCAAYALCWVVIFACALTPSNANAAESTGLDGVDVSNWQCGADIRDLNADFVVVGVTWGTGGVNNVCLNNGVNTDANRMLNDAVNSGKLVGTYAYAMGGSGAATADFYWSHVSGWSRRAVPALDWEPQDNPAYGNWDWVRSFKAEYVRLSGVEPLVYGPTSGLASTPSDIRRDNGLWAAQYASMARTGYQAYPWNLGSVGEAMRQYTSQGVTNTIAPVDMDLFEGSRSAWLKYADPSSTPAPAPAPRPAPAPAPSNVVVVKSGDCLSALFGANWPAVARANGITWPYTIWPGEVLHASTAARTVVVGSGDNLSSIAARLGVAVGSIHGYRSGNPNLIYPGEVLTY